MTRTAQPVTDEIRASAATRPRLQPARLSAALLCILVAVAGCSSPRSAAVRASADWEGRRVETLVDGELARAYFTADESGPMSGALRARIDDLERRYPGVPDGPMLSALTEESSTDFAALLLARRLIAANAELHADFERALDDVRSAAAALPARTGAEGPLVLFAPGWFYESKPHTGADFRSQRERLAEVGVENRLIPLHEAGTIKENAQLIAEAVREAAPRRVILASASKSGPETAWALGALLRPEESTHVEAWLNVGGVIGGTPLAEEACQAPTSVGVGVFFWWNDWDVRGLGDMRPEPAKARLAQLRFPSTLRIVNMLPVPLSGQVSEHIRDSYAKLAPAGPNDGLVLLSDAVVPGAETLVVLGADHYLDLPDMDDRALAMLLTLMG